MEGESTAGYIRGLAVRARAAAGALRRLSTDGKNGLLLKIADALEERRAEVLAANRADVADARERLPPALVDRLTLSDARYAAMVAGVRQVATLPDPVGGTIWRRMRPSGIAIEKVREPFGVVACVFESRPNVFVDTAALCLKTGNAVILRGGREALRSNAALAKVVGETVRSEAASAAAARGACAERETFADAVQFVEIADHAAVAELVRAVGLVDVAIPRGGERLIRAMCEAALIPVLKHYKGVCHLYVDDRADLAMALAVLDNAKCQRPSACNAVECLLVHEKLAPLFLPMVRAWAADRGVTLHGDEPGTEYLSLDLNVATVRDVADAIGFINRNSSHHSDAIVTADAARAAEFLRDVDSACVYHNASTRFTDGAEFGMGAEIGISTDKLHARGPMGLEELTTYKYRVTGDGAVR